MEAGWSKEPERNKGRGGRKGGGKTPEIQIQMKYNANTNTKQQTKGKVTKRLPPCHENGELCAEKSNDKVQNLHKI